VTTPLPLRVTRHSRMPAAAHAACTAAKFAVAHGTRLATEHARLPTMPAAAAVASGRLAS
jgi:hypothetical protein